MSVALRFLGVSIVLALVALPSTAGTTRAEEQIVYWPLVTDGTEYRRIPYPGEAGTLTVLADSAVVIEARRAPVYYWPITREYLADLSKDPAPVEGALEIVDAGGEVTVAEPRSFLLWHPKGVGAGPIELVHGEETAAFYDGYVKAAREAAEAAQQYQRIVAERQAAVEAWLRMAAERPATLPKPPPELDIEEPLSFAAFATEPRKALVISLPAGTYTVRIRDKDGTILEGSERELVSFAPLARAIGYVLRPEDRWTRPIVSFGPAETIYTTGRTDLFFQPVPVVEYEARRFTRLFRPQSVEAVDPSLTVWTPLAGGDRGSAGTALALSDGDATIATAALTAYRVKQLPGASRGYVIDAFEPVPGSSLEPDFLAMRVGRDNAASKVGLVDGTKAVPASERQIRTVALPPEALLFLPALLPLGVGFALRLIRRR